MLGTYYFLGAALCAGSAISSGLFVPMLMIGAVIGRMVGLATVDFAQGLGTRWSVGERVQIEGLGTLFLCPL